MEKSVERTIYGLNAVRQPTGIPTTRHGIIQAAIIGISANTVPRIGGGFSGYSIGGLSVGEPKSKTRFWLYNTLIPESNPVILWVSVPRCHFGWCGTASICLTCFRPESPVTVPLSLEGRLL